MRKKTAHKTPEPIIMPEQQVKSAEFYVWAAMEKLRQWPKLTALLCGLLLSLSLPPFYHLWAAFVAFSLTAALCLGKVKLCRLAAIGYWFGFGFFSAGFYWIGNALLVDAAHTGWLYLPVLLVNGAFFGIFTIVPFMSMKLGKGTLAKILLLAASWCLSAEWFRGVFLTGFPWNPLSSIMAFNPEMLQSAALWGTYGLSFWVVLMISLPSALLNCDDKTGNKALILSAALFCGLWLFGSYVLSEKKTVSDGKAIIVRLVQPSIPQALKWKAEEIEKNLQEYIRLSRGQDNKFVDFVVWGETAVPFDILVDEEHSAKVQRAVPPYGRLITGFLRYEPYGSSYQPFNSLAVMNRKGEIEGIYDKSHLVPFGEYIPLRDYLPDGVRPLTNMVAEFGRGRKLQTIKVADFPEFAPLICYEIIFSDEVVRKENKPQWLVVVTNDGWYGISSGPYQHLVAAQMRAVEEGISIVRSANSGISAVINPYGEILAQIPLGVKGMADATVKPDEARDTLFGRYGNKIPLVGCCGIFILVSLLSWVCNYLAVKRRPS